MTFFVQALSLELAGERRFATFTALAINLVEWFHIIVWWIQPKMPVTSLVEIARCSLVDFLMSINYSRFLLLLYLRRGPGLLSPKNTLDLVSLKLAQWFWRRREDVKSLKQRQRQLRRQITDKPKKSRWAKSIN